jgi:adenylate cyclase
LERSDRLTAGEKTLLERWKSSRNSEQEPKISHKTTDEEKPDERRLVGLMFTDMVGYTAMTQRNEATALEILEQHRKILRPIFKKNNGTEIDTFGDGFLIEFPSALAAVRCSLEIQLAVNDFNAGRPSDKKFQIRIGIHLGDAIHRGKWVYGDAVNIASRIHTLASPGSVCISEEVYLQVRNKIECAFTSLGRKKLKNIQSPVKVYALNM